MNVNEKCYVSFNRLQQWHRFNWFQHFLVHIRFQGKSFSFFCKFIRISITFIRIFFFSLWLIRFVENRYMTRIYIYGVYHHLIEKKEMSLSLAYWMMVKTIELPISSNAIEKKTIESDTLPNNVNSILFLKRGGWWW